MEFVLCCLVLSPILAIGVLSGMDGGRAATIKDLCGNCGYSLLGLPDQSRCPECGYSPAEYVPAKRQHRLILLTPLWGAGIGLALGIGLAAADRIPWGYVWLPAVSDWVVFAVPALFMYAAPASLSRTTVMLFLVVIGTAGVGLETAAIAVLSRPTRGGYGPYFGFGLAVTYGPILLGGMNLILLTIGAWLLMAWRRVRPAERA